LGVKWTPIGHGIEGFSGIWVGCKMKFLVMALRVLVEFGLSVKMESDVRVPFVHGIDGLGF
jgi:hypothetical protein